MSLIFTNRNFRLIVVGVFFLIVGCLALITSNLKSYAQLQGSAPDASSQSSNADQASTIASDGDLDTTFNSGLGTKRPYHVFAIALQADGKTIIGGQFKFYNDIYRNNIARINADGTLDTSFNPGSGPNSYINAISIQSDGRILIGGGFTSYNNIYSKLIARINADGSLDTTFHPANGPNSLINAISIQSDGRILIGGYFTSYDGVSRNRIARINSDGTLDTTFNPGLGADNLVNAITLQSNGKILVGGNFATYNGLSRIGITRLNPDGSQDITFYPGSDPNTSVEALVLQTNGKILIAGTFATYSGINRNNIARINADGSLDTSFNPGSGTNSSFSIMVIQSDGGILIGGGFTSYNGISRRIARINTDGSLDSTFNSDTSVTTMAIQPDGKILVGGSFTTYNGITRNNIARISADGSLDTSFNPGSGVLTVGAVAAIAIQPDGKILVGGSFTTYNGITRNSIARINIDGTLDTSFNPGAGADSYIDAILIQTDGKILIGGQFSSYNGVQTKSIVRINVDGSLDTTFNYIRGNECCPTVYDMKMQPDGKILISGSFQTYNNISRNGIARVYADGNLDTTFDPGSGASSSVNTIAIQPDGKILLGGYFSTYNGITRNGIARINTNGSLDTTFNPGSDPNSVVNAIALQPDGKILFGGANGVSWKRIARLNANGALDTTFDPGSGASSSVNTITIQPDGKILLGGYFSTYNGITKNHIARINANGSLDSSFNSVPGDDGVSTIVIQSDKKILTGGSFVFYNGIGRIGIVRLLNSCCASFPSVSSINPASPTASNIDQNITVNGNNFQSGLTVAVTFPDGRTATLSGTQIQNVAPTSFTMRITFGNAGNWSMRVINPDGTQSNVFNFTVQSNVQTPVVFSINPEIPTASGTDQDVIVFGSNFQPNLTVPVTFPDGGGKTLSGAQIQNVTPTSFIMRITLNAAGNWSFRVNNPDGGQSAAFGFSTSAEGNNPFISSINPSSPVAGGADQNVVISGGNFQNGLVVNVTFPNGGISTLQGTGQIQNVVANSFLTRMTLNAAGNWTIRVVNSDGSQSARFSFNVQASSPPPANLPTSVLSPVIGPLRVTSTNQGINDGKWEFNQHKTGSHTPTGVVSLSNDTFAWDVNLYTQTSGNADAGKAVFAVADGEVVSYVGNPPGGDLGAVLIAHPNAANPVWFSGYLHMTDVRVSLNQIVNSTTVIGEIGRAGTDTDQLQFVVYSGQNTRGNLSSFDTTITERLYSTPTMSTIDPATVNQADSLKQITINGNGFQSDSMLEVQTPLDGRRFTITPESISGSDVRGQIVNITPTTITAFISFAASGNYEFTVINRSSNTSLSSKTNISAAAPAPCPRGCPVNSIPSSRTPVILIPGFMGSRIAKSNGEELFPAGTDLLNLPYTDSIHRQLKDNIVNTYIPIKQRPVVATQILRWYVYDFYGTIIDWLTSPSVGYSQYQVTNPNQRTLADCDTSQKGADLFIFAYDWRNSNAISAQDLRDFVGCIKRIRDPNNTNPSFKVDIIAHSMGGLVARRYILDGNHYVDRMVTLGTPSLGAPKSILAFEDGTFSGVNSLIKKSVLKEIAPFIKGAQELIPSKAYTDNLATNERGSYPLGEEGWNLFDSDPANTKKYSFNQLKAVMNRYGESTSNLPGNVTESFHTPLLQDDWRTDNTGASYYHFVGRSSGTIGSLIAKKQLNGVPYLSPEFTIGDGTVPELSSLRKSTRGSYLGTVVQRAVIFNQVEHRLLTSNQSVLAGIRCVIRETNPNSCIDALLTPAASSRTTVLFDKGNSLVAETTSNTTIYVPNYSLNVIGSSSVVVSDSFGNTTNPLSTTQDNGVPAVPTTVTGTNYLNAVFPLDQNYKVVIKAPSMPFSIILTKSDGQTITQAIRYVDITLPSDALVLIQLSPQGITTLKYDSDGDGTFETAVNPTIDVTGNQAQDTEPPEVVVSETVQNGSSQIVLQATDAGTGVQQIMYSLDGTTFQQYVTPLILNKLQTPTIYAFADDNVANRSGVVTYNLIGISYEGDVNPRPSQSPNPNPGQSGDGLITAGDVTQIRRFALGLDTPDAPPNAANEFQKADCAPRQNSLGEDVLGDGIIAAGDVTQVRRYALGLDQAKNAGGVVSFMQPQSLLKSVLEGELLDSEAGSRLNGKPFEGVKHYTVSPVLVSQTGNTLTIGILLNSAEALTNSLSFTLNYEMSDLINPTNIRLGSGAKSKTNGWATLAFNVKRAELGRLGILIDLPPKETFASGEQELVLIDFTITSGAQETTTLKFDDTVTARFSSDTEGNRLNKAETFTAGMLSIKELTAPKSRRRVIF